MSLTDAEYVARRKAAWTDRGTCLFTESHPPGHPADLKFHVAFERGTWEDLTEAEIAARGAEFAFSSTWDFWYEETEPVA
jgi:hypothetical protein